MTKPSNKPETRVWWKDGRHLFVCLAAAAFTGGCATPKPTVATETAPLSATEQARLQRAASLCTIRAAEEFDDGVSPANVVAQAVADKCSEAITKYFLAGANGDEELLRGMVRHLDQFKMKIATSTVLQVRAYKRQRGR